MPDTVGVILTMTCVLFVTTLLRGFQSRAASSGHKTAAGIGGTLMSACEIIVMINVGAAVVHMENPYLALWSSFGAGAGWITGMILYARLVRKRREKLKALKKTKRHQQIERISREAMLDLMEERGM
jgi:hypothetical protein